MPISILRNKTTLERGTAMFKIFIASILLLLVACGSRDPLDVGDVESRIDLRVAEMVDNFFLDAESHGYSSSLRQMIFSVKFGEIKGFDGKKTILGVCQSYKDSQDKHLGIAGSNYIILSKDRFPKLSKKLQEYVIYHELGHCALGLGHSDDTADIMYPTTWTDKYWINEKEELLDKLFNRNNAPHMWEIPTIQN